MIPDHTFSLENIQTSIPHLHSLSSNCATYTPSDSSKFFSGGDLSIIHINARSLHQTFNDILTLISHVKHKSDFILISETWLDKNVTSCYQLDGYEMLHAIPDANITGKGCAIYVKKSIMPFCKTLDDLCACQTEYQSIFVQVSIPGRPSFIVSTVYRSPSFPISSFLPFFKNTLCTLKSMNKPCLWKGEWNINLFKCIENDVIKTFLDCFTSYGFYPFVTAHEDCALCSIHSKSNRHHLY